MVGVLTGMKLAVLRRSMSGPRAASLILGAVFGGLVAVGTALLGLVDFPVPEAGFGVLAVVMLLWTLGWALGPMLTGGDATLRLDYFTLVPLRPRTLALGLLGAGFVGITPLISLVAFSVLIVFGAFQGLLPALVAVPGALLQLLFVVVLSKFTMQSLGSVVRSRLGWELSSLVVGFVVAFLNTGWFAIGFFVKLFTGEWAADAGTVVRTLPSGWSVVAVDAARRSDWPMVAAALGGLLAVSVLLFAAWTALLSRQLVRGTAGGKAERATARGTGRRLLPDSAGGAVTGKELRLWARDPRRARFLRIALWTGVFTGLLPLLSGFPVMLPWTGVVTALFAGALCANLYGLDAGAIWLTLVVPGAERVDVRARQVTWLLVVAPVALVLTLALTAASSAGWAWPWVLATLPAVLGGAAGLIPLMSVLGAAPFPDRPGGNPLDGFNDESGDQVRLQTLVVLLLQLFCAAPAAGVVLAGTLLHSAPLRWAGVAVGLLTGLLYAWALGRAAQRRLETRGPEFLDVMRKGVRRVAEASPRDEGPTAKAGGLGDLSGGRAAAVGTLITLGILSFAPQGVVALSLSIVKVSNKSWFAALYLPSDLQIPVASAFILLGLLSFWTVYLLVRSRPTAPDHEVPRAPEAPLERAAVR
ncbi:hypothetical protein ABZW03_27805 [Kitasatospora sp. NPDC004799]|uniref:hypothetical protein n=1 Tax=Kitasatospora sp. NPDC004799 TaxID=3154460 RepID=UPI0033AE5DBE